MPELSQLSRDTTQMYYYSIFFSYGAFLSAQLKGHYTLKLEFPNDSDVKKIRREVWIGTKDDQLYIDLKSKGRGGEHEIRAKWFYEVFRNWDFRDGYLDVLEFESDRTFHTSFRNMYTYSLGDIARELFHSVPNGYPFSPSDEVLLGIWRRGTELIECYPETFWALEHIKTVVDLHNRLLVLGQKSFDMLNQDTFG